MQATSSVQYAASESAEVPPIEQVRDDVWAIAMPMPGGHIPYSLNYVFRDAEGGLHVVDPGSDSAANWQLFVDGVESIGAKIGDIRSIIVTHMHPDHFGMALRLRDNTGAQLMLHRAERDAIDGTNGAGEKLAASLDSWGVPADRRGELIRFMDRAPSVEPVPVDRVLADGELIELPGITLTVMLTQGHTGGSICLRDDDRNLIITGDHILPTMHAGLGLGAPTANNPLVDYLSALRAVADYADHEIAPGHGYRFTGVAKRAHQHAEHHLRRTREVAVIVSEHPDLSLWDVASRIKWSAGWENLNNFFLYSALLQSAMHRDYLAQGGAI